MPSSRSRIAIAMPPAPAPRMITRGLRSPRPHGAEHRASRSSSARALDPNVRINPAWSGGRRRCRTRPPLRPSGRRCRQRVLLVAERVARARMDPERRSPCPCPAARLQRHDAARARRSRRSRRSVPGPAAVRFDQSGRVVAERRAVPGCDGSDAVALLRREDEREHPAHAEARRRPTASPRTDVVSRAGSRRHRPCRRRRGRAAGSS